MAQHLVYLAGMSGSGKSSVVKYLHTNQTATPILSVKTRSPRPGEVQGVDGWFVSEQEFAAATARGELVGARRVLGHSYAYRAADFAPRITKAPMVLEVAARDCESMRGEIGDGLSIYLIPSSLDFISGRIMGRDAPIVEKQQRLAECVDEMEWVKHHLNVFDALVQISEADTVADTCEKIRQIIFGHPW